MTQAEQQQYAERLHALQKELEASLREGASAAPSVAVDNAIGRLSRMEAIQAQQMMAETQRRLSSRLKGVLLALGLVAEGRYGMCVRCGAEIERGRLDAMPEAWICVACAARNRR